MNIVEKMGNAIADYLRYLEEQDFSDSHIATVASRLNLFAYPSKDLPETRRNEIVDSISFRDIHGHFRQLRKLGRTEGTLAGHRSSHIAFWNWCISQNYRSDNPAEKLKRWSFDPVVRRAAPSDDVDLVLASLREYATHRRYHLQDVRDALLISLCGDNAGRLGAVLDTRMSALKHGLRHPTRLNDGGICYHIAGYGKTGGADLVFFETTAELANIWCNSDIKSEFVFCNMSTGKKLSNSGASKAFTRICAWVGLPEFRSHALRKRNVTEMVKMSGDWKVAQQFADHKDIKTTMTHYNDFERDQVDVQAHQLRASRKEKVKDRLRMSAFFKSE